MTVPRWRRGRTVLISLLVSVAVLGVGARVVTAMSDSSGAPVRPGLSAPWVGLVNPSEAQASELAGGTVTHVVVGAGWSQIAPSPGRFDEAALTAVTQRIDSLDRQGFTVVLDLGLQYPPQWVFDLPGDTRFVNQYGDVWHGTSGTDVANAVFNTAVRTAAADYVAALGRALAGHPVAEVRVGGLLSGELRYPPGDYNGHRNSIWAFDARAASFNPSRGWTPGTGSRTETATALQWYFDSLTRYLVWLMKISHAAFGGAGQQILLPSWGLRPGMVDAAIADDLDGSSVAEANGLLSSGGDWANQVKAVASTRIAATLYTTWLDAPDEGSTVTQIPPVAYLVRLAADHGLPVAGENTGGGGIDALRTCIERAARFGLTGLMYMSGPTLDRGEAGLTLPALTDAATELVTR